ncbi:serine/threonine-protein kinase [bacterium]
MRLIGKTINGYKLLSFLGEGGFGSVYKVEKNKKLYAIKIFREAYILDEFKKGKDNRISREIEIMQKINHASLVKYIEHFYDEILNVPQIFIVMEFINGKTLSSKIKSKTIDDYKNLIINILNGINILHTSNIIHRDLKPDNILVQDNGEIKILDYGLSKLIDYTSITNTGDILGTFKYMSPEQITDSKHIDIRSDLYSIGMIFYEILTGELPFVAGLVPEFIDKIKNEPPIPPRKWNRNISNKHENIILKLLEKDPYKRYSNVNQIIIELENKKPSFRITVDNSPKFILRTYNEKASLEEYIKDHPEKKLYFNYPANHQFRQKGLLKITQNNNFETFVDPATIRLAYTTYTDVRGLLQLPYCPDDYSIITPTNLSSYKNQKKYVKLVIDEQVKLKADILTSPYHYSHNTNVIASTRRNPVAEWFDLDIKLLQESLEYRNNTNIIKTKPLFAGICINALSLSDELYKKDFLNTYASINCDGFLIYADGIDRNTTEATLYHYITTLLDLKKYAQKPVIAGRIDTLGLGLISLGLTGYTSGAARFENFYEDLYKEVTEAFNMYERYYFPELLGTIAITKKDPVRLQQIVNIIGQCSCQYCKRKPVPDLIKAKNTKLHYLELVHREIDKITQIEAKDRVSYFIKRIDKGIANYKKLSSVFKTKDYNHLLHWKNVFKKLEGFHV